MKRHQGKGRSGILPQFSEDGPEEVCVQQVVQGSRCSLWFENHCSQGPQMRSHSPTLRVFLALLWVKSDTKLIYLHQTSELLHISYCKLFLQSHTYCWKREMNKIMVGPELSGEEGKPTCKLRATLIWRKMGDWSDFLIRTKRKGKMGLIKSSSVFVGPGSLLFLYLS